MEARGNHSRPLCEAQDQARRSMLEQSGCEPRNDVFPSDGRQTTQD